MQGERGASQVNQHTTNQVETKKMPSNNSAETAEGDTLDSNMDTIAQKLGMILKMLEHIMMLTSKKKSKTSKG